MPEAQDVEKAQSSDSSAPPGDNLITTSTIGPAQTYPPHSEDNAISLHEVDPVDISVRNLSVSVDETSNSISSLVRFPSKRGNAGGERHVKKILDDVSAEMPRGTLTAIIGGSGSGKTSLLNVMSSRMHGNQVDITGSTLFNGVEGLGLIKSAYVMQQDVLIPTLTIRETLRYAADLRLGSMSKEERRKVVEEVILELGLKEAADTRIGNSSTHRGCSGGEKRRTSVAIQLLANPSVLFCDEVTTGLDSKSADQLITTLKNLAKKGRTVVTTIHQPRSEIWDRFDNIVLLTRGSPAYSGPKEECIPYFERIGFGLPEFVNPAEHLIDILAVDSRSAELEEASTARVDRIKAAWRDRSRSAEIGVNTASSSLQSQNHRPHKHSATNSPSLSRQIKVLTARTWLTTIRDPMGMFGSLVEAISMAVINGWIFYNLDGSLAGIRSREGALYTAAALQGYLILLYEVYRLSVDIELFERERNEGVVKVPAFLASRRLARFLVEDIPVPLVFSLIFYFMTGFRTDGTQFMTFFSIMLLQQYIAVCFAMLCIGVSRNFAGASLVANLAYTLQSMACGYFIQANSMPIYVRWTKWIAYVFYGFGALAYNEFFGHFYDCPEEGGASSPACNQYRGDYILNALGMPPNWLWRPIVALLGFAVAFYIGAAFILAFWKTELRMSRRRPMDTDESAGKEKLIARSVEEVRTIDIRLEGYGLDIEKREWWGGKRRDVPILKSITTEFQPGVLNVIMGPSGSGKTTLLNSMAKRLKDDLTTKYRSWGNLRFNGDLPSEEVVRSITSFVTQDDDALLSSLTVRETLRFAAGLRLPKWMSKEEKNRRAEDVLLNMGLKDCADTLIGSDLVKGISGGEKRRVTIAVQILDDPRVLLCDEPTSGLDAFTASSIIDVLQGLANEGRTLILTIHQPRSDLFPHFGNVLLLARGGSPVYSGRSKDMLSHFASQGFNCPRTTNPADFALDVITVDLQQAEKEAASRAAVRKLIESWRPGLQPSTRIATPAELGSFARRAAAFRIAFPILVRRALLNFFRQPPLMIARIMQVVGLAIVLALFFAPLKNDYYSIQNRLGYTAELAPLYFVGLLQCVAVYPGERDVAYRELDDRAYGVEAFFLQYTAIEIPFEVITSLLFSVLADLACGLPRTAKMFFIVAYNCFCIVSCGESLGIVFNTLFEHTGFAVNVTSVVLSVAQIMGGILSVNIPSFLQAFNHLSPVKYLIGNLAPYTFQNQQFTCESWQRLPNGQCPVSTGEQVLRMYNLDKDPKYQLLALGICAIVYRILAYVLLKIVRERWISKIWKWRSWKRERFDSGQPHAESGSST